MVPPKTVRRSLVRAAVAAALTITSTASPDPRQGSIQGSPEGALKKGGASVRLTGAADRAGSPLLIVDFGKEVAGHLKVRVKGATGNPKLRACFSESVQYMALAPDANGGQGKIAPGCDTANIWNGFPGQPYTEDTDSHALPLDGVALPGTVRDGALRGGFRYATLFLDGPGSVDIDAVSLDFTAAPDQRDLDGYRGHFLSSDDLLNKVWYAGAYTVQINTGAPNTAKKWPYVPGEGDHADAPVPHADPNTSVIYDGGKRDRIVWQGDLAVQAPVAYVSTYDMGAVDNSLSSLAAQQLPDGYVPAASLVGQHNQNELRTYGEYVTWFVTNMYDHWWYTGDRAYLDKWWPQLTKATAWLESVRAGDDKGLIAFQESGSCGHYGYSNCGHETYVNALYARNLRQMAAMAKARGDASAARTYAARSAEVKKAVNDQLWDEKAGAYRLSREIPGAYPQDGNVTAVLTGIAGGDRAERALAYLRANNWTDIGSLTVSQSTPNPSLPPFYAPLPSGFEADARLETGDASGLELIRNYWGHQLRQDPACGPPPPGTRPGPWCRSPGTWHGPRAPCRPRTATSPRPGAGPATASSSRSPRRAAPRAASPSRSARPPAASPSTAGRSGPGARRPRAACPATASTSTWTERPPGATFSRPVSPRKGEEWQTSQRRRPSRSASSPGGSAPTGRSSPTCCRS